MNRLHRAMGKGLAAANLTPREAVRLQEALRGRVERCPLPVPVRTVAGTDLSFARGSDVCYAGIVVLSYPGLEVLERVGLRRQVSFPYVPGLLAFREAPPLLECWQRLTIRPDVLLVDGHGLAHPRRFGLACHLGLLCETPAVGCAKRILVGGHDPLGEERGQHAWLRDGGEIIGAALRTRTGVQPVYISVGHRCLLEEALDLVLHCAPRYRLPETTRQAHRFVNQLRMEETED